MGGMIDNTLAANIPQFNLANTLQQGAQAQAAQDAVQQEQTKAKQQAVGAEMRGVAPFVNTPDFPAKWAEAASKLLQNGTIDQATHDKIANSPSPLMLKSIIAQTDSPEMALKKTEDDQAQKNTVFSQGIQTQQMGLAVNADKRAQTAADNANMSPLEKAQERAKEAEAYGLKPGTPEHTAFTLTGNLPDSVTKPEGTVKSLTPGGELYHLEGGKVVVDHKNDKSVNTDDVSQETVNYLADRSRMGDPAVKVGYARNPGMIARIDAAARQREADGVPISDEAKNVTNNKVTLSARGSAERKLGTINTNNEFYGNNALGALDIAEKASDDVPRTNYPGVNKALNAYRTQTGDPKTVALGAALNTVVNDYAKFTGGGIGTDSLRGHAEEILNGAHSAEQLKSITHMMRLEIKRGQQSPGMVREGFGALYAPSGSGGASPAAPAQATDVLQHARDAIAAGAPREAVIQRLKQGGVDPSGL